MLDRPDRFRNVLVLEYDGEHDGHQQGIGGEDQPGGLPVAEQELGGAFGVADL